MTRVAINGFGRIGRLVARAILERPDCGSSGVDQRPREPQSTAWLFRGQCFTANIRVRSRPMAMILVVDGHKDSVTAERDPASCRTRPTESSWVLECTGFFTDREGGLRISTAAPSAS